MAFDIRNDQNGWCQSLVRKPQRLFAAFTIVELLTILAIVGILAGLILPVVQSAREASRQNTCKNNLMQLAKGVHQHETKHGYFPTGGWGPNWLATTERANDASQPGGWTFTILPFLERENLFNSISGVTSLNKQNKYESLCLIKVSLFFCPSRRGAMPIPVSNARWGQSFRTSIAKADADVTIEKATRLDYAANGGSLGTCMKMPITKFVQLLKNGGGAGGNGNGKVTIGHRPPGNPGKCNEVTIGVSALAGHANHTHDTVGGCDPDAACDSVMDDVIHSPENVAEGDKINSWPVGKRMVELDDAGAPDVQDGLVARMGRVPAGSVLDGLSNVYLLGEKYVASERYDTGNDRGDASILYAGYSASNVRWADSRPRQDMASEDHASSFGSAHSGTWNAAFGDGSVRSMSYDIDLDVHKNLAAKAPRYAGEVLPAF